MATAAITFKKTTKGGMFPSKISESKIILNENTQPLEIKWPIQKVRNMWYLMYAWLMIICKLKFLGEFSSRNKRYDPSSEPRVPGETVVITGGPRGIAYEVAKKFLRLDYMVIMGCQNVSFSQTKVDQIRKEGVTNGTIYLFPLNLGSLASTKKFSDDVLKITSRIDLLINNGGIMMTPYASTEDGYEKQFQVNYLSHFLLTMLLLPAIKQTSMEKVGSCTIINTTSVYHHAGSLDFSDLETRRIYAAPKCYFDSKLCQVLFTKRLEKLLEQENVNVHTYAVHPGAIPATDLWANSGFVHNLLKSILKPLLPTIEDGADAIMYAALCKKLETRGGSYLEGLHIAQPNPQAENVCLQALLWKRSKVLCQTYL